MVSKEKLKEKVRELVREFEDEFLLPDEKIPYAKQVAVALVMKGMAPNHSLHLPAWNIMHEKMFYRLLIVLCERGHMTMREIRNWIATRGYNDEDKVKGLQGYADAGIIDLSKNGAKWEGV